MISFRGDLSLGTKEVDQFGRWEEERGKKQEKRIGREKIIGI